MRLNSDVMVLPLALSSGPASETLDEATSSAAGAPPNVSTTSKKFPPDCASFPVTVELVNWRSAWLVVLVRWAPCPMKNALQHAEGAAPNWGPKPRLVWLN